jgi:uncharacterized protein YdhG (YjbR/CyaY superfamily)
MAVKEIKSVTGYIAAQPAAARAALKRVRSTMRKAMPRADEVISYSIPAYKLNGRVVIFFAGWKQHYSITLHSLDATVAHPLPLSRARGQ